MVNVNFNVWGKERIIESTPSTLGADASVLRSANPVGLLDIDEPYGTNPEQNTYVITHGFQNTGGNSVNSGGNPSNQFKPEKWMSETAKSIRELNPDANIILVDWEDGAKPKLGIPLLPDQVPGLNLSTYDRAASNTREVGDQLAQYLKERNIDPNKTELIGHSLGAHVSGFAGTKYKEITNKELNRITGLDPASFGFEGTKVTGKSPNTRIEEISASDRLDPDDAKRVVVIHTSSILGNDELLGDVDFFVNPNTFLQPGKVVPVDGNHGYATDLYTQLLKGNIFPQSDGSNFNSLRLSSPETGRINVDTTKVFFEGSTSGIFDNGENKKILGDPADGDSESYVQFDGRGSDGQEFSDDQEFSRAKGISTASDIPFSLGNLTYRNGKTFEFSTPKGDFPLDITLSLTNPVPSAQTFNFSFNLTATENTGDLVKDADILRFSDTGISQEIIRFPGSTGIGVLGYRLELVGFSTDGGKTTLGRFDTPEQRLSDAQLIGKIKPVSLLEEGAEVTIEVIKELPGKIGKTVNDFQGRVATFSKGLLDGLSANVSSVLSPPPRVAQNLKASAEQNSTFQITEAVMAEYPGGLLGTESDDRIIGSSVTDIVLAGPGADSLEGGTGGDYLLGGKGDDRILGEDANDILTGNQGNDFVLGGVGDDLLRGGKGNDQIFGDDGEDILIGERGTDRLTGGGGSDIFILRTDTGTEETNPVNADWILDFNASEGDLIGINGGVPIDILTFTPIDVNQDGTLDTIIQYTETNEIFGIYTNIFGVAINTPSDVVKSALFTIPLNDPITQIG